MSKKITKEKLKQIIEKPKRFIVDKFKSFTIDDIYRIVFTSVIIMLCILLIVALFVSISKAATLEEKIFEPVVEEVEEVVETEAIDETPTVELTTPIETVIVEEVVEEKEQPVIAEPTIPTDEPVEVNPDDAELLARVIYQEAGADAQCDMCRRRIADVVLNRVESDLFPNTVYGVLTQESQYGRYHWTGVIWPERASYSSEAAAVARARRIAQEVLSGQHSDLYGKGYIWQAGFTQGSEWINCCGIYFGK